MNIWSKYLVKSVIKTLLFLLLSVFVLYTIIDLSTNSIRFFKNGVPSLLPLFFYYIHHFIRYLDIFLPLTFMLALIRILYDMQTRGEITPLLLAGISRKKILIPLFCIATFLFFASFANFEYFVPKALDKIEKFRGIHSKKKAKKSKPKIGISSLKDGTNLVYQKKEDDALIDVFWVVSNEEVWHMKRLELKNPPQGFFIDHFERGKDRKFTKIASFEEKTFTEMKKPKIEKKNAFIPYENRSISALFTQLKKKNFSSDEEEANIYTHLYLKLLMPLLPFLITIAIPPYLFRFSRNRPIFLIASLSLTFFVTFFTFIDAAAILAENQVIPPLIAIGVPFLLSFSYFGFRFLRFS